MQTNKPFTIKVIGDHCQNKIFGVQATSPSKSQCAIPLISGEEPDGVGFTIKLLTTALNSFIDSEQSMNPSPIFIEDQDFYGQSQTLVYALYKLFRNSSSKKDTLAWRLDSFFGSKTHEPSERKSNNDEVIPDLFLVGDKSSFFRDKGYTISSTIIEPWIVATSRFPVAEGKFWQQISDKQAEKTILCLDIEDIRTASIQISRHNSWEKTAQELAWELNFNPAINYLSRYSTLIVSIGLEGVFVMQKDRETGENVFNLIFDPSQMEDDWENNNIIQLEKVNEVMQASVAYQIYLNPACPDVLQGCLTGLDCARQLNYFGMLLDNNHLSYPYVNLANHFSVQPSNLSITPVKLPWNPEKKLFGSNQPKNSKWSIFDEQYNGNANDIARRIVLYGADRVLVNVPLAKFGNKISFDRYEIESLNSISKIISDYTSKRQKKPLSIAVFGAPGSGKSFAVEQLGKSIVSDASFITFNLAQFTSTQELISAFHQVRDINLSGKTPFVFWDEFDTNFESSELGWLRYFLSPMQDGSFQEGDLIHPIGKCIFVFAGGTSSSFHEFTHGRPIELQKKVKLPDFISRLKGTLDVYGPNNEKENFDQLFVLRRALILRSMFERNYPNLFITGKDSLELRIDSGLLNAFLEVDQFKHGSRSMETILQMSCLSKRTQYSRSDLPSESQLELHVDAKAFLALANRIELHGENLEKLARAAHELFCEELLSNGFIQGPVRDDDKKTHPLLISYDDLPEAYKEQNRLFVIDVPSKLASLGYIMEPAKEHGNTAEFDNDEIEVLSKIEHDRWCKEKYACGWKYGPISDRDIKIHSSLVPWENLSELDKNKDIKLVSSIPTLLAKAGFAMRKHKKQ